MGPAVFVAMKPPPAALLAQIRKLQPNLKRLAVLWNSVVHRALPERAQAHGGGSRGRDRRRPCPDLADLPNALRSLAPKPDALWLAPDPSLITPSSFQTIKQFSWDSSIPFYAPTPGSRRRGPPPPFRSLPRPWDIGSRNSRAGLFRSGLFRGIAYSEKTELIVNPASAAKAGLVLTPEALARADKVLP